MKPFPFRFGVQSRSAGPRQPWLETVRRIEALGYDSISWPDHFVRGFEPVAAMAARHRHGAAASLRLRLRQRLPAPRRAGHVRRFDRRPLQRSIGAGIGAGWLKDEYDQSGIPFDPASVRIARLAEAVHLLKLLLSGERTTFSGEFYSVDGLQIPPAPVQRPHPPLVIGGGSPKFSPLRRARRTSSASPRGHCPTARRTPRI